jgi:hypothetical protein
VSPGAQGPATSPQGQPRWREEAKLAAGDPTEDEVAIAQASDIPKTPPIQAGVVSPGRRQGSAAFPQTTDVGEVNYVNLVSCQAIPSAIGDEAVCAQAGAASRGNGAGGHGGGKHTSAK